MMKEYDLVVVGGGPGGYVAALRARTEGASVALVEARELGGTCLNRGCIPSKTYLQYADVLERMDQAREWGIETGEVRVNMSRMLDRKNRVIGRLRSGIESLIRSRKIELFRGIGTARGDGVVEIGQPDGTIAIRGRSIILATGSAPFLPPIEGLERAKVHTSDTIFDLPELPSSICIIGGGVIGVEFAQIFASFCVNVTIVELTDRLIPSEDADASRVLHQALREKGVTILTGHRVRSVRRKDDGLAEVTMTYPDGREITSAYGEVIVCVGRKPNLQGLEPLNLKMNGNHVAVNEYLETSVPNVYAVGDLIGGYQLAHAASAEGIVAAVNAVTSSKARMDYRVVPRCIYTSPEIASVGMSEQEAEKRGYKVRTAVYPLHASGKAMAMDARTGFVKVIADSAYGEILGAVIVGPHATEMISEASAFLFLEGTVEEMARMIHPHPTLSEGLFEAAAALTGKGVHM